MSYHVTQTPQFKADMRAAVYGFSVTLANPDAANALLEAFDKAAELISVYPFSMQPYPLSKPRAAVYRCIDVKNYLAFYVVQGNTVEFRRFLHARSDLPAHLGS